MERRGPSLPRLRARLRRLAGPRGVTLVRRTRVSLRRGRTRVRQLGRRHPSLLLPASREYGFDRGTAVDRHYIEGFLEQHAGDGERPGDIRGHVLEFGGDEYTRMFGSRDGARREAVERVDVMDVDPANRQATIAGDLAARGSLPAETFDCIVCTEVLMLIYDLRAAVANLHGALRPGGVLLVTVSGISQVCRPEMDAGGDYWRFTSLSLRRLLGEVFPPEQVEVRSYGNVRSATAFLYGLAAEELSARELDLHDPDYEVTIAARAVKPA